MGATAKPKPAPLSLSDLRQALAPEPVMSTKIGIRLTRTEHERLQRLASAAGVTLAHCARRILATAAEALLAEQEAI